MSDAYEHERTRLHALVDRWIDSLNDEPVHAADQRIDTAVIAGVLRGTDSDGDDVEAPSFFAEPRAVWQQVGLFTMLLRAATHGHATSVDDEH